MKNSIYIVSTGSLSALGSDADSIWAHYRKPTHFLNQKSFGNYSSWVGELNQNDKIAVEALRKSSALYQPLDASVLYALYTSREAVKNAGWGVNDAYGINIGSSRGATRLFEDYHKDFLAHGKAATLSSPTTTLGNISSWVAQDRMADGPVISHSITCSTALHALLNAIAWIKGGMAERFLVGGSEAALTPFTIAQMEALKIISKEGPPYPCRSLDMDKKKNTMVLGEGAAVIGIEKNPAITPMARIEGIGMATERLTHNASISTDALCFQKSMKMALGDVAPKAVDVLVAHAPGTLKGDLAELKAIDKVFQNNLPAITANKWKIGHTFGASGMLSLEMALLMMANEQFIPVPFLSQRNAPEKVNRVMVNAVGFGGNAVSILLTVAK